MSDVETWAAGLALTYSEPDRETGKTICAGDILIAIERELAQDAPLIADDTVIPEGGTLAIPSEAKKKAATCAALAGAFPLGRPTGAALRQDILDLVFDGEMRPAAAEEWAARFGWRPFAGWAAFEHFDPRSLSTWTLAQAACWIAHHESDPSGVHERMSRLDPARIAASTRWIAVGDGYEVGPREDRGYSESEDARTDAKAQLLAALRAGQMVAKGERDGMVCAIPREEWPRLAIIGFHDEHGVWRVVRGSGHSDVLHRPSAYEDVRLEREKVLALWPDPANKATSLREAPFAELVALLRAEGKPLSQKDAGALFISLSLRVPQKVRDAVVDEVNGTKPGARPRGRPQKKAAE